MLWCLASCKHQMEGYKHVAVGLGHPCCGAGGQQHLGTGACTHGKELLGMVSLKLAEVWAAPDWLLGRVKAPGVAHLLLCALQIPARRGFNSENPPLQAAWVSHLSRHRERSHAGRLRGACA